MALGGAWRPPGGRHNQRALPATPLTFPAAAWGLLHPLLAGLWRNLCADAIPVADVPQPAAGLPRTGSGKPAGSAGRARPIRLPPPRQSAYTVGADTTDRAALLAARRMGQDYRRLPRGWEARQRQPDFQHRRTAAIGRAGAHHCPAPPPGFTFVRPFVRGTGAPAAGDAPPQAVHAPGLCAVLLGLAGVVEADEQE